jgi:hypothetical protein
MIRDVGIPGIILLIVPAVYLAIIGFIIYFLVSVFRFMRNKTEQGAELLQKIDRLIQLQESQDKNKE